MKKTLSGFLLTDFSNSSRIVGIYIILHPNELMHRLNISINDILSTSSYHPKSATSYTPSCEGTKPGDIIKAVGTKIKNAYIMAWR